MVWPIGPDIGADRGVLAVTPSVVGTCDRLDSPFLCHFLRGRRREVVRGPSMVRRPSVTNTRAIPWVFAYASAPLWKCEVENMTPFCAPTLWAFEWRTCTNSRLIGHVRGTATESPQIAKPLLYVEAELQRWGSP